MMMMMMIMRCVSVGVRRDEFKLNETGAPVPLGDVCRIALTPTRVGEGVSEDDSIHRAPCPLLRHGRELHCHLRLLPFPLLVMVLCSYSE